MAKTATKAKPKVAAQPPKPTAMEVPLGEIDPSIAYAVRSGSDPQAVERYAEAEAAGVKLPRVDLYAYQDASKKWVYLMPDGGHRFVAFSRNKRKTIASLVRKCKSKEEAERLAWEHAAGTNAEHGLPRSPDDKRATVTAILLRPEHGAKEDRKIAALCKVSHYLVRKVREEMTREGHLSGKASAEGRYKDSDSDYAQRAKGGSAATPGPEPSAEPVPENTAFPSDFDPPVLVEESPIEGGSAATPEPAVMVDELGRSVPAGLLQVFAERRWFRAKSQQIGNLLAELEEVSQAPHGAALTMNPLRVDGENLSKGIAGAAPYCVCPDYVADVIYGVEQPCDSHCKHCSGRGWLSRLRFKQLPNAKQRFCESFSTKQDAA